MQGVEQARGAVCLFRVSRTALKEGAFMLEKRVMSVWKGSVHVWKSRKRVSRSEEYCM